MSKDKVTNTTGNIPKLLNIKKASVYSGIPIWGIRQLIWNEQIPYLKITTKYYLVVEDIDSWINKNKTIPDKYNLDNS